MLLPSAGDEIWLCCCSPLPQTRRFKVVLSSRLSPAWVEYLWLSWEKRETFHCYVLQDRYSSTSPKWHHFHTALRLELAELIQCKSEGNWGMREGIHPTCYTVNSLQELHSDKFCFHSQQNKCKLPGIWKQSRRGRSLKRENSLDVITKITATGFSSKRRNAPLIHYLLSLFVLD